MSKKNGTSDDVFEGCDEDALVELEDRVLERLVSPERVAETLVAAGKRWWRLGRLDRAKSRFARALWVLPGNERARQHLRAALDEEQMLRTTRAREPSCAARESGTRFIGSRPENKCAG